MSGKCVFLGGGSIYYMQPFNFSWNKAISGFYDGVQLQSSLYSPGCCIERWLLPGCRKGQFVCLLVITCPVQCWHGFDVACAVSAPPDTDRQT